MKTRVAVACVVLVTGGVLLPSLAQEDKPPAWDQILKMVERTAATPPSKVGSERLEADASNLQLRLQKAQKEVKALEALLAMKKAEVETIQAERTLYLMSHGR